MTLIEEVKDSAKAVFNELGTGHSEAVYESAMVIEMGLRDIGGPIVRQVPCPILYRGYNVGVGFIDIMIGNFLLVELKAIAKISNRDEMQVRKYLLGSGMVNGLLINFTQANSGTTWEGLDIVEVILETVVEPEIDIDDYVIKNMAGQIVSIVPQKSSNELYADFLDGTSESPNFND